MTRLQGLQDYKSKDSKGYNRFQRDMDPLPYFGSEVFVYIIVYTQFYIFALF